MPLLQVCCGTFSLRANIIIMNKGRILKRQQVRTLLVKMCVPKIFFKLGWRTSVCRNTTKTICIWQCIAMFLMQTNKLFIQQLFLPGGSGGMCTWTIVSGSEREFWTKIIKRQKPAFIIPLWQCPDNCDCDCFLRGHLQSVELMRWIGYFEWPLCPNTDMERL